MTLNKSPEDDGRDVTQTKQSPEYASQEPKTDYINKNSKQASSINSGLRLADLSLEWEKDPQFRSKA